MLKRFSSVDCFLSGVHDQGGSLGRLSQTYILYDRRSQLKAMIAHDVSAAYGDNMEKAAARVKAQVLSIVNLQGHMVNPNPAIRFVKLIHAQSFELNNDCGHLGPGCETDKVDRAINEFLEEK